jgi:hypothetical protein
MLAGTFLKVNRRFWLCRIDTSHHDVADNRIFFTAANWSTAVVQDYLRGLLWDDSVVYLHEKHYAESVFMELE